MVESTLRAPEVAVEHVAAEKDVGEEKVSSTAERAAKITERFASLSEEIRTRKRQGAPIEDLVQQLRDVKAQHFKLTRRRRGEARGLDVRIERTKAAKIHRQAEQCYPPSIKSLPRDPQDSTFVLAFDVDSEVATAVDFFKMYGFVVFKDVLSSEECADTRQEIFEYLATEHPGFSKGDARTHDKLSSVTYGLPAKQAMFTRHVLRNRQHPKVIAALRAVLGSDDILVSHDRWCTYRPTHEHADWKTRGNLHLDVHPWGYVDGSTAVEGLQYVDDVDFITELNAVVRATGPHVQGVLNLLDNRSDDGGTQLVPKFHHCFEQWQRSLGPEDMHRDVHAPGWVVARQQGGGSYKFSDSNAIHARSHRIPLRAGSFLLWNQELVHGSQPNNASPSWRVAQFIKAFRTAGVSSQRLQRRACAVEKRIREAGLWEEVGSDVVASKAWACVVLCVCRAILSHRFLREQVTPAGARVFGLQRVQCSSDDTSSTET
eukprot:m.144660 g.144660  ORF g.144660 m.144660 type:complete len:488 (-) comp17721_c0_seq1:41-1504(-)